LNCTAAFGSRLCNEPICYWTFQMLESPTESGSGILISRRLNRPRSNGVHNNKNMGLTQSKRLAWRVRTALTFMLCSPTINFRCETNPTISPVTNRTQLFSHMTTHVHNLEGHYRLRVQFSCHKDFRDLTETLMGSLVNVWPRDIFTYFSDLRLWYHLLSTMMKTTRSKRDQTARRHEI
jgi:hypothetical protein